jgi:DNA polymerase III subunit delta'
MPLRDIVGHRAPLALLSRAVSRSALPHSLIFAGPDGVGKRLTALAVAQLLNCTSPMGRAELEPSALELDACGACSACRRIAQLTHPDVVLVTANPPIDEARDVMQTAAYRPFEGRRRVFILDDADAMSAAVQNAWLKTLEEPPSASYFLLVSARPDLLLPTVRSRCPSLRFGRLPIDEVVRLLVERHGMEPREAREGAFASDGSPGRALLEASDAGSATRSLVDRVVAEVTDARSSEQRLRVAARMLEAVEIKSRGRSKSTTRWASEREVLGERLDVLGASLRDLSVVAAGADEQFMAHVPSADTVALAQRWDADRLIRAFTAVDRAREALERNASPKAVADWLALQL